MYPPKSLSIKSLATHNRVTLTPREIDILSCILNGRSGKGIANLVTRSVNTVDTHTRNIMTKLECHSREELIRLIEKSSIHVLVKQHYTSLQIRIAFEQSLKEILKTVVESAPACLIVTEQERNDPQDLLKQLKAHLSQAGIKTAFEIRKEGLTFPAPVLENLNSRYVILTEDDKGEIQNIPDLSCLDFTSEEGYYASIFEIIRALQPSLKLENIILEFKEKFKILYAPHQFSPSSLNEQNPIHRSFYQTYRKSVLSACLFVGLIIIGISYFYRVQQHNLQSALVIPKDEILIDRSALMSQIDRAFRKSADIQTVALVGIGGAGKTTAARQYAHQQNSKVIWEINAESSESLKESFENLAQGLAVTEVDKRSLSMIQANKGSNDYQEVLMQFVRERLKQTSNWLLVYDNVETFASIQNYFPNNSRMWGKGRVILTTRDSNIGNNQLIQHIIPIKEIGTQEKLHLFTKIMADQNRDSYTEDQIKEIKFFLEKIPPFPLDISIAACYLKATNLSPSAYLTMLSQSSQEFIDTQENILRESGEYTKTRYSIIVVALEDLIHQQKDFQDLFLLISLINPQNIPRYLLNSYKNNAVVDQFILNLRKHSLVSSAFSYDPSNSMLSMHRNAQEIIRSYLIKKLDVKNHKEYLQFITENLENNIIEAIPQTNLKRMRELLVHCDSLLSHKELISEEMEGIIKGGEGIIHYYFGDNQKAKRLLEEAMSKLDNPQNAKRSAFFTGYLGNVYRDLGDYHKGRALLIQCLEYYEKTYPRDAFRYACFLRYLGIIERYFGNYQEAQNLFEKGLRVYKSQPVQSENYVGWVSGQLGILHDTLGNHEKAQVILEPILANFKKIRPDNHLDIAWALEHLGSVYINLGDYIKAKDVLKKSLNIYSFYFPDELGAHWIKAHLNEDSRNFAQSKELFKEINKIYDSHFHNNYIDVAWSLNILANIYAGQGKYEKSKLLLEQCLCIYQKNYGNQHLTSARIFIDFGKLYFLAGELEISQNLFEKALVIYQCERHSNRYVAFEMLSEVFLKKAQISKRNGEYQQAELFKSQALDYLKKALEVTKVALPETCPRRIKMELKLKNIQ